jgi:hypothetical protein
MRRAARISVFAGIGIGALLAGAFACGSNDESFAFASSSSDASATFTPDTGRGPSNGVGGENLFGDNDGCNVAWQEQSYAKMTDDTIARTGSKSCRVCARPGFRVSRLTVAASGLGSAATELRLAASVFVRAADDRQPPSTLFLTLRTSPTLNNSQDGRDTTLVTAPLTNEWREMHVVVVGKSFGSTTVTVDVEGATNLPDAGPDGDASASADADADAGAGDASASAPDAASAASDEPCFLVDDLLLIHAQ